MGFYGNNVPLTQEKLNKLKEILDCPSSKTFIVIPFTSQRNAEYFKDRDMNSYTGNVYFKEPSKKRLTLTEAPDSPRQAKPGEYWENPIGSAITKCVQGTTGVYRVFIAKEVTDCEQS